MNKWQLHEAKNKLSNIIDIAMHGTPQCITKRGEEAVVIISIKDYKQLTKQKPDFKEYLLSIPKTDNLDIQRAKGYARDFEL
ncbi:prevent-host-death family protein [Rickettsia conorii subsp. heilongjiangensis]|uniref:Antitoxin n=10 Tax=spotted fever group TaxID=114277 RepID=A0AAD1CBW5_RICJA|nr:MULTISPECIES: type II toxin-antitoxin system Phd/YefM family antitoxin [spotted fever group]AAL03857.1 unknown [Rickettsia conorii str. Malish 7]AEK75278.1 hypothetical protein Rh054_07165 [Rickettsia conorii subsp. heilongjiangensis 054]AEV92764.1 Putative antitoxin of toxin-antitoxin (TA) system [Rickettsia slovaca 13-B]AFC73623.1 Putative antitoxin of toxin-antitoxin (TA) system [Rickettsia montanensis str. OSU 85-930]AFC75466.1 Putative antitoxin of toxin-antitoxin (TA) system [Ricketts